MSKLQKEPTKLVPVPSTNKIPERDVDKSPILEARHLGIDFGGLTAVNDFNMAIGRTEIAGLIGPNGAGKTTVFNLLTKVYQPTRGTILLDGHDTAGKTTVQVNRMGIARTFQNIRLFSNLSVEDNVKIGLHNHIGYGLFSGLLRLPLRLRCLADRTLIKRLPLMLGNSICCPAISYNKRALGTPLIKSGLAFALDWDCLDRLACEKGRFICEEQPLLFYRVHGGAATKACMEDDRRGREEREMFSRYWPEPVVRLLMRGYRRAYKEYD